MTKFGSIRMQPVVSRLQHPEGDGAPGALGYLRLLAFIE